MKRLIHKFALWLLKLTTTNDPLPDYAKRAAVLVMEQSKSVDTSGEYKRHQVFAKLKKEFPGLRERDLGLAIELAVQRVLP